MVEIFIPQTYSIGRKSLIASDESEVFLGKDRKFGQIVLKAYHPLISLVQLQLYQNLTARAKESFDRKRILDFIWNVNPILRCGIYQQDNISRSATISPFVKGPEIWRGLRITSDDLTYLLDAMTIELNDRLNTSVVYLAPSNVKVVNKDHLIITDLCSVIADL